MPWRKQAAASPSVALLSMGKNNIEDTQRSVFEDGKWHVHPPHTAAGQPGTHSESAQAHITATPGSKNTALPGSSRRTHTRQQGEQAPCTPLILQIFLKCQHILLQPYLEPVLPNEEGISSCGKTDRSKCFTSVQSTKPKGT